MEQFLKVGIITSTHGLKGEVKIYPTTDSPERFLSISRVYIGESREKHTLVSARFFKQFVIGKFKSLDSIEAVEGLKGREIFVERADGAPLGENEYYIADLIGMRVNDKTHGDLGTVSDVLETGANDVYIVKGEYGEVLIPAIRQCILNVDVEAGTMEVDLLPGLLPDKPAH